VPFNARSHIELFQKIRAGKFRAIPPIYSAELQKVIASCLQVNPNSRPTAAQLLELPIMCVTRKQNEAVALHAELTAKAAEMEARAQQLHDEINAKLRREWEVRAQLEIDRQCAAKEHEMQLRFEAAVASRAEELFQARLRALEATRRVSGESTMSGNTAIDTASNSSENISQTLADQSQASYLVSADLGTNISRLSLDTSATIASDFSSQGSQPNQPRQRPARTPFTRAHTLAANPVQSFDMADCFSPMDVHMASPSPASLTGLNLSPGRRGNNASTTTSAPYQQHNDIFATNTDPSKRWLPTNASELDLPSDFDSDSATEPDDDLTMHSPSRPKRKPSTPKASAPHRKSRPSLVRERTAPANLKRLTSAPSLFPTTTSTNSLPPAAATAAAAAIKPRPASAVPASPSRKTANASDSPTRARSTATSPVRKPVGGGGNTGFRSKKAGGADGEQQQQTQPQPQSQSQLLQQQQPQGTTMKMAVMRNQLNGVHGRTLVELAQARAGGVDRMGGGMGAGVGAGGGVDNGFKSAYTSPTKTAPVWDPERDEMPSPFLARGRNGTMARLVR
jgi:hypothetical protein